MAERKFTVRVASPSQCKRVLSLDIDSEEIQKEKARVADKLRRELKVPGFRKGKVPEKFVQKNYASVIHGDAVRNLLPKVFEEALDREGISPVGEPSFDNLKAEDGSNITVDVSVEVKPDVTIKGYKGIKVKVSRKTVDDKAVDHALAHLQERMTTLRVVDRETQKGDFVLIDYAPILDNGEIDEQHMSRNYPVDLDGAQLLPEFLEALPGMAIGEDKDVRVRYPEDFPDKDNAGTEKVFRVTVKEVKEKVRPDIDDAFAQGVGSQFKDLAALRKQIEEDLIKDEEKRFEHDVEESIIEELIRKNPFDVPETMVQNYLSSVLEEDRQRRPQVEDEAEREKEVREHFHAAAVRTIRKYFVLDAVKKQETIRVDPPDVDAKINEIVKSSGDRADKVQSYFRHPKRRQSIESELLDKKVLKFLADGADVKVA
ncbi:MAG: trigger factor [bacterium]|nr:trigger factor [bacterium]